MTLRILIVNDPGNPTDKEAAVKVCGPSPYERMLKGGQAVDVLLYEGQEITVKEADVEPKPETPQ